ncbi:MAG: hypothetical protein IPI83_10780 [Sphingomonadales bacterium]|nr:hypothetical protein [Sphingomonadales bacterium]
MRYWLALVGALFVTGAAFAQVSPQEIAAANRGIVTEQGRDAAWHYAQHRLLGGAINALKPQRPGVVDAYVIVAGLDSDPSSVVKPRRLPRSLPGASMPSAGRSFWRQAMARAM